MYGTVGGEALSDSRCRDILFGGVLLLLVGVVVAFVGGEVHSIAVWRVGNFFRGEADMLCSFK